MRLMMPVPGSERAPAELMRAEREADLAIRGRAGEALHRPRTLA